MEQYAGRLHRDYEGKQRVVIYDYVDIHVRVLEKMYHKRLKTYRRIGYCVCSMVGTGAETKPKKGVFAATEYEPYLERDLFSCGGVQSRTQPRTGAMVRRFLRRSDSKENPSCVIHSFPSSLS